MSDSPPGHPEVERLVAPNPGPLTLAGTNTYLVADGGSVWVIDPGPAEPGHLAAISEAAARRGGLAGILLTHSHADHSEAAGELGAPLLWGSISAGDESSPAGAGAAVEGRSPEQPADPVGPFRVVPTPGHSVDHVCLLVGRVCFCGDLVLGTGSSFVPPDGGSLAAYLDSLARLRGLDAELLCPGHGPYVTDPRARIDEYVEHRLDRERRLVAALGDGVRSRRKLLDRAWDDVPPELRPAAALVMQAHLEKLAAEGRVALGELVD
ncbi:MAG TPA: MBL fold metallo-hydrolase [Solirubrobacterales bacterium]|nr:MBL fold metallo-hydrolase [Solirubrobacterales bacterium]